MICVTVTADSAAGALRVDFDPPLNDERFVCESWEGLDGDLRGLLSQVLGRFARDDAAMHARAGLQRLLELWISSGRLVERPAAPPDVPAAGER